MDITINSFVHNVFLPCFGPAKPPIKNEINLTREEVSAIRSWQAKADMFEYDATAMIANNALVAAVASVALAAFGAIGPLFVLALFATAGATHYNAASVLRNAEPAYLYVDYAGHSDATGLRSYDFDDWKQTSLNICDLVAWFNLLPSKQNVARH